MDYGLCRRCLTTPAVKAAVAHAQLLSLPGFGRGGSSGASSFRWSIVDMVKLSKEAKQRLQQLFKGGQFAIRWGFIPLVIYLGQWLKNLGEAAGQGLVGLSLFFWCSGAGKINRASVLSTFCEVVWPDSRTHLRVHFSNLGSV